MLPALGQVETAPLEQQEAVISQVELQAAHPEAINPEEQVLSQPRKLQTRSQASRKKSQQSHRKHGMNQYTKTDMW